MIVICDKAQDVIIPAGLGDNPGVVYEKSGVESLNGQQGDLTLKTVNGNELLGEGNIEIKSGVESVNGETGAVKIKSVNGTDMLGEGDVAIDTGVESLNGQKGALTLKTVNGNELTGEGNIEIQAGGVESLNGQTGALKLKTIDNKDVLGEGNMDILSDYSICMFMMYNLTLSEADKGVDLYKYGIGDDAANLDKYFSGFKTIQFLNFNIKDGASYKVPVTIFWDGDGNRQFRFVCEGYEYTYTSIDANYCDFTSKVKVGGESSKTYYFYNDPTRDPNAPNAHNVEVFRAFDKAVQEGGAFNNFYIVNGNETSGQKPYNPILQVTKMANGEWGANKGYYVFAGQKSNENSDKLQVHQYCLTDIGGVIDFMVNAVDGGTWTSGVHSKIDDVLTAGQDIPFVFEYLEGCDETYFWADNMGGKQGLYNITFNGGYDGYKGNVVADVYGNDTGVYMAFTVNNVRYTYKKNDTNSKWELAKSVQIGGVQSAEVSNIKVLTQSEYDALEPKDPNTMYCIKGQ